MSARIGVHARRYNSSRRRAARIGRMAPSVLQFDSAEHRAALDDQALGRRIDPAVGLQRAVLERAEHARALHHHAPRFRYSHFNAAEHGVEFEHGLLFRYLGLAEIDFEAAENRVILGAAEVLVVNETLAAAEHHRLLQSALRGPRLDPDLHG